MEASYLRDAQGRIRGDSGANPVTNAATLGSGVTLDVTYDSRGRRTVREYKLSATGLFQSSLTLDRQGSPTAETVAYAGESWSQTRTYTHDLAGRLTDVEVGATGYEEWVYDLVGNWSQYRLDADLSGGFDGGGDLNQARDHNDLNEIEDGDDQDSEAIVETSGQSAWVDPAYDARGNMTVAPAAGYETDGLLFTYDCFNRVTGVYDDAGGNADGIADPGEQLAAYTYDAANRRVSKTVGSTVTRYVYSGSQVLAEYDETGTPSLNCRFVYGEYADDPVAMEIPSGETNPGLYYYIRDARFNVTALTNAAGAVVERYRYTAFGVRTMYAADGTTVRTVSSYAANPYGFSGRRYDVETGLWYYRNRMYHAALGRFLQRDPAGYVDGMHLYAYVMNNPMAYVDPSGMRAREFVTDMVDGVSDFLRRLSSQVAGAWNSAVASIVDRLGTDLGRFPGQPTDPSDGRLRSWWKEKLAVERDQAGTSLGEWHSTNADLIQKLLDYAPESNAYMPGYEYGLIESLLTRGVGILPKPTAEEELTYHFRIGSHQPTSWYYGFVMAKADACWNTWGWEEATEKLDWVLMADCEENFRLSIDGGVRMAYYGGKKYKGYPNAARNIAHFYENNGYDVEIDVGRLVLESRYARDRFFDVRNRARDAIEGNYGRIGDRSIVSKAYDSHTGKDGDTNWHYTVNHFESWARVHSVSRERNTYRATMNYFVRDVYDWDIHAEWHKGAGKLALVLRDRDLALAHRLGIGRAFRVTGQYPVQMEWQHGERLPVLGLNDAANLHKD